MLIQNIGVILAVGFSVYGLFDSRESYDMTKEQLIKTDNQLIKTDEQLSLTKAALDSSSKVSQKTLRYLDSISESSQNLKNNFDSVSNSLRQLPIIINSVESNLRKISELTQEQKEIAEKERNKMPKLVIEYSCIQYGILLYVKNEGDMDALIEMIKVRIEKIDYDIVFHLDNITSQVADLNNSRESYWYNFPEIMIGNTRVYKLDYSIINVNPNTFKRIDSLEIEIFYKISPTTSKSNSKRISECLSTE